MRRGERIGLSRIPCSFPSRAKKFPALAKKFPACLRREFDRKLLNSHTVSRRIFAKNGRIGQIPCVFPCGQGILATRRPEFIHSSRQKPNSGHVRKTRIVLAATSATAPAPNNLKSSPGSAGAAVTV